MNVPRGTFFHAHSGFCGSMRRVGLSRHIGGAPGLEPGRILLRGRPSPNASYRIDDFLFFPYASVLRTKEQPSDSSYPITDTFSHQGEYVLSSRQSIPPNTKCIVSITPCQRLATQGNSGDRTRFGCFF